MVSILKLSEDHHDVLGSDEILFIHLGNYLTHGKVSFSTDISVAQKPEYVLLVLGNVEHIGYLCKVSDHDYSKDSRCVDRFLQYSPARFRNEPRKTWLLFDSMQKISIEHLDQCLSGNTHGPVYEFITDRANYKILEISDKVLESALNQESCVVE